MYYCLNCIQFIQTEHLIYYQSMRIISSNVLKYKIRILFSILILKYPTQYDSKNNGEFFFLSPI